MNQNADLIMNTNLWPILLDHFNRVPARKVGETAFNGDNYDLYIFDVHKNDCRILARIDSTRSKIFIREILSHADYDKWIKSHIK